MPLDQIIVFVIVGLAAWYLVRLSLRKRANPGCGGCDRGCTPSAKNAPTPDTGLVQLQLTPRPRSGKDAE